MVQLVGGDGKSYDFPEDKVQEALGAGFTKSPEEAIKSIPVESLPGGPVAGEVISGNGQTSTYNASANKEIPKDPAISIETQYGLVGGDNKVYAFPKDKADAAIKEGFRPATAQELKENEHGALGLKPYLGGTIDAALTGAIEHIPFVQEKPVGEGEKTPEQIAKEENAGAYYTGAVGGEVTGAGFLGGVAKPLIGARLAGYGKAAAEGLIYSADPVAKSIINKDYGKAAAEAVGGALFGAAIHGAFALGEKELGKGYGTLLGIAGGKTAEEAAVDPLADTILGKAADKYLDIPTAEREKQEAQNAIGKALGLTPKQRADFADQVKPMLKAAGVTPEDFINGEALKKVQSLEESGPAIGRAIKLLDGAEGKEEYIEGGLKGAATKIKEMAPTAFERDAVREEIANWKKEIKKLDPEEKETKILWKQEMNAAQEKLDAMGKELPSEKQALKALKPMIDEIAGTIKKGTFEETQKLKRFAGEQTNWLDNKAENGLRKSAYHAIVEGLLSAEDSAALRLSESGMEGMDKIHEGLKEQRAAYSFYKIFGDLADRQVAKSLPNNVSQKIFSTYSSHRALPIMMLHMVGASTPVAMGVGVAVPFIRAYLEKRALLGAAKTFLQDSTTPATATVLHAMEYQEAKITEGVKDLLGGIGRTAKVVAIKNVASAIGDYFPKGHGLSGDKAVYKLSNTVNENVNNPEKFADRTSHVVMALKHEGLDNVAMEFSQHQLRLQKVIQSVLPQDPAMANAHPFTSKVTADEISAATKAKYENALRIAADPTALLAKVKNNTITAGDVAIAAAVNPATLQKMRDAMIQEAMKSKPDLSYQQRLSVGILMGQNIDESTDQVPLLQSGFPAVPPMSGPPTGRGGKGKLSATASKSISSNFLTTAEKAAGHGM